MHDYSIYKRNVWKFKLTFYWHSKVKYINNHLKNVKKGCFVNHLDFYTLLHSTVCVYIYNIKLLNVFYHNVF